LVGLQGSQEPRCRNLCFGGDDVKAQTRGTNFSVPLELFLLLGTVCGA
jgi:hypothetical protein